METRRRRKGLVSLLRSSPFALHCQTKSKRLMFVLETKHKKRTYSDDHLGTSLGCEHGENTGTASNIEDDLVLEQVAVLVDRGTVGQGANLILQHFLLSHIKGC